MDSIRIRKGPVRALVAVCLLAGVFAMHGLTGNHEVAMALTQQMPTAATSHHSTTTGVAAGHSATTAADHTTAVATGHTTTVAVAGHSTVGAAGHTAAAAADHGVAPAVQSGALQAGPELIAQPGHDGHLHSMGDVCLAMLAALLLALVVALALRSLTVAHPAVQAAAAIRVATDGPSPPWRRPTLSKLCVLRT